MDQNQEYRKYVWLAGGIALIAIAFAALGTGVASFKSLKHPTGQVGTITVSGEGEVTAMPDIATVTATIRESAATVPEAQKLVEAKVTQATKALSGLGVNDKDVTTISYNVNPKYDT